MALTINIPTTRTNTLGTWIFSIADITFDSSYDAGGEGLTPADMGITTIYIVNAVCNSTGYVPAYNYSTEKLMMFEAGADGAALDEVTAAVDLSAEVVRVLMIGE